MTKHSERTREWHLPPYLEGMRRGVEVRLAAAGIVIGSRNRHPAHSNNYSGPAASEALQSVRQQLRESIPDQADKPFVLRVPDPSLVSILRALNESPRLEKQRFVDIDQSEKRFVGALVGNRDSPLRVPVANIVHAPDFMSWEAGLGPGQSKIDEGGLPHNSRKLIRRYSRIPDLPPIEHVAALIQPNDLVVYSILEGRHRAAATIQRGEPYVNAECISICQLTENVLPLPPASIDTHR